MKVSLVIIAHNEERYIARCLLSVMNQTRKPDEVLLVAHNITDRTIEIAKKFPVTIIPYNGPWGIVYPRIRGFEEVTGDVILCLDGDSFAANNWVEEMVKTLESNKNLLVGSWVKFKGTLFGLFLTKRSKNILKGSSARMRIWGPSFAFWARDKEFAIKNYLEHVEVAAKLKTPSFEDYWFAQALEKKGNIAFTNQTYVEQNTKEMTSLSLFRRFRRNSGVIKKVDTFIKTNSY